MYGMYVYICIYDKGSIIKGKGMLPMSKEHFVISHDVEVKESCITLVPYEAKSIQGL